MLKGGSLHPALNRILSETGHTDVLTICDRGFPVPLGVERVDLALTDNIPTVLDVLRVIDKQFVIGIIIVTDEMMEASRARYDELQKEFPHIQFRSMSHVRFKQQCGESRAVIRTGDSVPYANLMIISG